MKPFTSRRARVRSTDLGVSARRPVRVVLFTDLDSPFGVPHAFEFIDTPGCTLAALVVGPGVSTTFGVMAVPDRWGRPASRDLLPTAAERGIAVLRPERLDDPAFVDTLTELAPDLIVSAGYRRLVPSTVLALASVAAINFHPSALPRMRGRNPFFWTVASGESRTAATAHHMMAKVDTGDIAYQSIVPVDDNDTASSIRHKTTVESLRLVARLVADAAEGRVPRLPVDAGEAQPFREPTDDDRAIDWSAPAAQVHRMIRAGLNTPGALTRYRGRTLRVLDAEVGNDPTLASMLAAPGTVLKATPSGVAVKAGDGHVVLRRVDCDGAVFPAAMAVGLVGGDGANDRFL